jgi:hypothetical protein
MYRGSIALKDFAYVVGTAVGTCPIITDARSASTVVCEPSPALVGWFFLGGEILHCMNCDFLLTQSSIEGIRHIGSSYSRSSSSKNLIELSYLFGASNPQEPEYRFIVFEGEDCLVAWDLING